MRFAFFAGLLILNQTCGSGTEPPRALSTGTWGGENAAVIVEDTVVHIHIGCTFGNARPPAATTGGRFELTGSYNIDAYPVNLGVFHPARITGVISGRWMQVTVALQDTEVTLGPVTVMLGREPAMQQCPICRNPSDSRTVGQVGDYSSRASSRSASLRRRNPRVGSHRPTVRMSGALCIMGDAAARAGSNPSPEG